MTGTTSNAAVALHEATAEAGKIVRKEIAAKWGKFSQNDLSALNLSALNLSALNLSALNLSALKGSDGLVNHIVAGYGLEKAQAQRNVDALPKGRHI
jgi:hypothetical protein